MAQILDIVNKNDEIIGQDTRENIHQKGLLHREVHVYFITPNREVIFQHRAKDKDLFPDKLDAAVGGHLKSNESYEQAAVRETEEETGVKVEVNELVPINKVAKCFKDEVNNKINNVINYRFAYVYPGNIQDLRAETGKAIGFEVWPIDKLLNLTEQEKDRFLPMILEFTVNELADFIKLRIN